MSRPFSFTVPPFSRDYRALQNAIPLTPGDAALAFERVAAGGIDPRRPFADDDAAPVLPRDGDLRKAIERTAVGTVLTSLRERYAVSIERPADDVAAAVTR